MIYPVHCAESSVEGYIGRAAGRLKQALLRAGAYVKRDRENRAENLGHTPVSASCTISSEGAYRMGIAAILGELEERRDRISNAISLLQGNAN
jgi:hypothetical protein